MVDAHLSIGEVLALLQDEFPDVTISKIRFLESQGLIDPERTPSGYRKFYRADIDRLRWILVQQREHFLPLKVIKDRLEASDGVPTDDLVPAGAAAPDRIETAAVEADAAGARPPAAAAEPASSARPSTADATPAPAAAPTVRASMPAGEAPRQQPIWMADVAASRTRGSASEADARPKPTVRLDGGPTEISLTAAELCETAGITAEALRELERFGLLSSRSLGADAYFDGDALLIATKSAPFLARGIDARHLRMFKVAAEREAGVLEQVAMPLLKQRNPEARRQAVAAVEELADLGHDLRAALLRANLRRHFDRA